MAGNQHRKVVPRIGVKLDLEVEGAETHHADGSGFPSSRNDYVGVEVQ